MAKMRQQVAELQRQGKAKATTTNGVTGESKPKPKQADLQTRQTMVDMAKAMGNVDLARSTQRVLDEAKAAKKAPHLRPSSKNWRWNVRRGITQQTRLCKLGLSLLNWSLLRWMPLYSTVALPMSATGCYT